MGRVQSRVATLFGVASLLVGCSHRVDLKKVPLVETTTKIVALDGSFTLTPGKPVAVPFNSICPKTPDTGKSGWGGWNVTPGAKAVRVYVPGMDPFFGLLAFCPVWSDYDGPAASSYLIKVSDDYVNQTDQDRADERAANRTEAADHDRHERHDQHLLAHPDLDGKNRR